ncbi:hypothetical protein [Marinicellulosiphila megalodicopiae]|uniref:hypothetical protein n=1 Tax=Marinicellulosiphila megalodicopiae TaxID=2724896 RepID=UPI003BAE269A
MIKSFLKCVFRTHYDNLEFVEDKSDYDQYFTYLEGKPFTGVAWSELQGITTEDSFVNGLRQGRCVKVYFDETLVEDGYYVEDEPVGEIQRWYESGQIKSVEKYDQDSNKLYERNFNLQGILIKEVISKPKWKLSLWAQTGERIYESENNFTNLYSLTGKCVISIKGEDENIFYDDQELFDQTYNLLKENLNLVEYPLFKWLNKRLDENCSSTKALLYSLLEHPIVGVTESALFIIEHRNYKDAIPLVRKLTLSKRKKQIEEGGFMGTTSELAQRVLIKLIEDSSINTKYKTNVFLKSQEKKRASIDKRKVDLEVKIAKVKKQWPTILAVFKQTYNFESTVQTVGQLFNENVVDKKQGYTHVYEYVIEGKTYRACYSNSDSKPMKEKILHYRLKKPSDHIF